MSRVTKIIVGSILVFGVILGIEGYYYFRATRKIPVSSNPSFGKNQAALPSSQDKSMETASASLVKVNKSQVESWAKIDGLVLLPGPGSIKALVGYFKAGQKSQITLTQNTKDVNLTPQGDLTVWSKGQENFPPVIIFKAVGSSAPEEFLSVLKGGDLILAVGVSEEAGKLKTSNLVIFK